MTKFEAENKSRKDEEKGEEEKDHIEILTVRRLIKSLKSNIKARLLYT